MNQMIQKFNFIFQLAQVCHQNGTTMTVPDLASALNQHNHRTSYGSQFVVDARGIYKVVSAAYKWFYDAGMVAEAEMIAEAFVKPDGMYAYEHEAA